MQPQVAALEIEDERDRRLERRDVREVLLRADADVGALHRPPLQLRQDVLERDLAGPQVVGEERAARLRQAGDERVKISVAERRARRRLGGRECGRENYRTETGENAGTHSPHYCRVNVICTATCTATGLPSFVAGLNVHCFAALTACLSSPSTSSSDLATLTSATVPSALMVTSSCTMPSMRAAFASAV